MLTIGEPDRNGLCDVNWNGGRTQWVLEKVGNSYRAIRPDGTILFCDSLNGCKMYLHNRFSRTLGCPSELQDDESEPNYPPGTGNV